MKARLGVLLAVLCVGVTGPLRVGEAHDVRQYSLHGLEGLREVRVLVEGFDADDSRWGVSESAIQTQVELYLRHVTGLDVIGDGNGGSALRPRLYVKGDLCAHTVGGTEIGSCGHISLDLKQQVTLHRLWPDWEQRLDAGLPIWDSYSLWATTWHKVWLLPVSGPAGDRVRTSLALKLDRFHNEYLKANPDIKPGVVAGPESRAGPQTRAVSYACDVRTCKFNFKLINIATQLYFAQNEVWPSRVTDMLDPSHPRATTPAGLRGGQLAEPPMCPFETATSPKPYALVPVYQIPGDATIPIVGVETDWNGHWFSPRWCDTDKHLP